MMNQQLFGAGFSSSPLVFVRPASALKKKSCVPSKKSNSETRPKNALKCVRTFSHYFFDLYASTNADFLADKFCYLLTDTGQTDTEDSSSPLNILIGH